MNPTQIPGIAGYQLGASAGGAAGSLGNFSNGLNSLNLGGILTSLGSGAAGYLGTTGAANAQSNAIGAGVNTQTATQGNINQTLSGQLGLGNNSFNSLNTALNGPAGSLESILNAMPGYQFAVGAGTTAAQRAAAASGDLYTPNTAINIGNTVTGLAQNNYQSYMQNLLAAAGFGASGNQLSTQSQLQTGGNISTLQQNQGTANASGIAGGAGVLSGLLNPNTGLGSLVGSGLNSLFGSGSNNANNSGVWNANYNAVNAADQNAPSGTQNADFTQTSSDTGPSGGLDYFTPDVSGF